MRILYIVPNPPSLVRVRPYNLIRQLHARGHHTVVATVWSNATEHNDVEELRSLGISVLASPLTKGQIALNLLAASLRGVPLQAYYAYCPGLNWQIHSLLTLAAGTEPFDLVHIEHLRGTAYARSIARLSKQWSTPLPIVWDSVDCISHLFAQTTRQGSTRSARMIATLELSRTRSYEATCLQMCDRTLVASNRDREAFCEIAAEQEARALPNDPSERVPAPCNKIRVIPNGVDLDYFRIGQSARNQATVLFTGKMSYHANVTAALWLANEVMPLVWAEHPDVQLWIVGKDPPEKVRALERRTLPTQNEAQSSPNSRFARVRVIGTVPDMRPFLQQATVAAAAVRYGAGIQNKVLEAMASGTPVVASRQAMQGIRAVDEQDLLVADDASMFAQHLLRVLSSQTLQRRLGAAGRVYVERNHSWEGITSQLEQVYAQVVVLHKQTHGTDSTP